MRINQVELDRDEKSLNVKRKTKHKMGRPGKWLLIYAILGRFWCIPKEIEGLILFILLSLSMSTANAPSTKKYSSQVF
jgi:hypothetical protein